MMKKIISTSNAPAAIGPYSQAVKAGDFIFISGQLPINPVDGTMPASIKDQTRQSLKNIQGILDSEELDMRSVVRVGVFLDNMNDFGAMNEVYEEFFRKDCPARAAVEVAKLPKGALVEIEAVVYCACEK